MDLLLGAMGATAGTIGLFFFRFWRHTGDSFFLYFALSFWIQGADRIALGLFPAVSENNPVLYGVRLLSYGLIVLAVWRKNQRRF